MVPASIDEGKRSHFRVYKPNLNPMGSEIMMRYVTHHFAHVETLERARRWLIGAGIDPSRIEARTNGMLTLAVAVDTGESARAQCIFDAAESSDPDGHPAFWELVGQRQHHSHAGMTASTDGTPGRSRSFEVGWHPQDADRDEPDIGVRVQNH
jgi:hypothetical protein